MFRRHRNPKTRGIGYPNNPNRHNEASLAVVGLMRGKTGEFN